MENDKKIIMSEFAFERMQAKEERSEVWKNVIIIVLIVGIVVSNVAWIIAAVWFVNQFEFTDEYSIEAEQDGDGVNIVGGGDVAYGTESQDHEETIFKAT